MKVAQKKTQAKSKKPHGLVARVVVVAAVVVALVIALGIVFVVFNANRQNGLVAAVTGASQGLVGIFVGALSPRDPNLRVVVDWGLIAVAYLVLGQLLARLLDR